MQGGSKAEADLALKANLERWPTIHQVRDHLFIAICCRWKTALQIHGPAEAGGSKDAIVKRGSKDGKKERSTSKDSEIELVFEDDVRLCCFKRLY